MPKVSVVVPIYNVEKYLRECLNSIVNQTLKDIEIICVNDCSTDNSLTITKEYAENDERIKVLNLKENVGLGEARNHGLHIVTGEYIMFVDSDDWLELNACETALKYIEKNKSDICFFNYYNSKTKSRRVDKNKLKVLTDFADENGNVNVEKINLPYFTSAEVWYKIYRHSFLKEHNCKMNGRTFEDALFSNKCFIHAKNISVIDEPLYNYRKDNVSSITQNSNNYLGYIQGRKNVFEYTIKNCTNKKALFSILVHNTKSWIHHYKKYSQCIQKNKRKEFYEIMRETFIKTLAYIDFEELKPYIDYMSFFIITHFKSYKVYDLCLNLLFKLFHKANDLYKTQYVIFFISYTKRR